MTHPASMHPTSMTAFASLEPELALLAAVYLLAIHDARQGRGPVQREAVAFLVETVPDWVERYKLLAGTL